MNMGDPGASDELLLERYAQGEAQAFELFFERHRSRVYHYALKKLKRPELAAETVQDVFLKLHARIHQYRFGERALPWFFAIVHHACLDEIRRLSASSRSDVPMSQAETHLASQSAEAWAQTHRHTSAYRAGSVHHRIRQLPSHERLIVEERIVGDKPFGQIAAETGKKEASLRKVYSRALAKMRHWFAHDEDGEGKT
jgi:RNA polymerase sigma-70 factor (ECF subfamily)